MGLQVGSMARVIKVWSYFSPKNQNMQTKALLYIYAETPAKECKAVFLLDGPTKKKGLKVGEKIWISSFEVIGNKNAGYMFILHDHDGMHKEKKREFLEQYIGSFDLPEENPFTQEELNNEEIFASEERSD